MNKNHLKSIFESPLARQFFSWTVIFGTALTILMTTIEAYVQYSDDISDVEIELNRIIEVYPQNLALSLWQFNAPQSKQMLEYIVNGTSANYARLDTPQSSYESGLKSLGDTVIKSTQIVYIHNKKERVLGQLHVESSLSPIYNNLITSISHRLLGNLSKSFLVVIFSFYSFYILVNRHLNDISLRINNNFFDKDQDPIILRKSRYLYIKENELDKLVSILNNTRIQRLQDFQSLNAAYKQKDEDATRHQSNLSAIGHTLASFQQFVSVHDSNGVMVLSTPKSIEIPKAVEKLLNQPYHSPEKLKIDALKIGLQDHYTSHRKPSYGNSKKRYSLELEDKEGSYWRADGIILQDGTLGLSFGDITALKKIETELSHAKRLESIGTLAGGIAHEFNNILAIIVAHIDIATAQTQSQTLLKHLNGINNASDRASELINGLLTFARKSRFKVEVVQISQLINQTLSWSQLTLPQNVKIKTNFQNKETTIKADQRMLDDKKTI